MADLQGSKASAEALKQEANALYQGRKFKEAYTKYSEAIGFDDSNAILFANRAACSLEMQEYLDAACDARQATKLDSTYVKAWARLAKASQALKEYSRSADAWENALGCYPSNVSQMSEAEKQMKASCEAGLRQTKSDLKELDSIPANQNVTLINKSVIDAGRLPWQIAERMEVDINKIGPSSAWVILNAHRDFKSGCDKMFQTVEMGNMVSGPTGAIADITNGLLRDHCAFYAMTPDWINTYNRQIIMENECYEGWPHSGPTEVQEKALALQKEKGFEASRGALSITIRGWLMRAYLEDKIKHDNRNAMQFYRSVLSVLEWGLNTWKDVPNSERGAIFNPTFVRGVRRHYLNSYLGACRKAGFRPVAGVDPEELNTLAAEQILETRRNMPKGDEDFLRDGGFYSSFFAYPMAEALAIRGAIAMDRGVKSKADSSERANEYFTEGKNHYMAAAGLLPKDEENRLLYMKVAFEAVWHRGDPISECLGLAQSITSGRPAVSKIWQYSSFKSILDGHLLQVRNFKEKACTGIIEGDFFPHSPATVVNLYQC